MLYKLLHNTVSILSIRNPTTYTIISIIRIFGPTTYTTTIPEAHTPILPSPTILEPNNHLPQSPQSLQVQNFGTQTTANLVINIYTIQLLQYQL